MKRSASSPSAAWSSICFAPERMVDLADLRVENDLYILKSGTELALSVAGALHALGAATLNPYPTVAMMRNKIIVTRMLKEAGVPTPDTYVASDPGDFRPLLEFGPLILKPYRGSRGAGIHIGRKPQELDGLNLDGLMLAQRYHVPEGPDYKIYCIGGRLIAPLLSPSESLGGTPSVDGVEGDALGLSASSVRRVNLNGNPYSAELRRSGKGRIEIVSDHGSQDHFHAAGGVYLRDAALQARNPFARTNPDLSRTTSATSACRARRGSGAPTRRASRGRFSSRSNTAFDRHCARAR